MRTGEGATLSRAITAARIIESAESYSRSDIPLRAVSPEAEICGDLYFYDDESFWRQVLSRQESWGAKVQFDFPVAVSEWIARVPGLFWRPHSRHLRNFPPTVVESRQGEGVTLSPLGKSSVVEGGIGTLRLPPNSSGFRLITLTQGLNASAGIPALVAPEVWDHHGLGEGAVIVCHGGVRWRPMEEGWGSRFPSVRGIPRGYLVITDPDSITMTPERRVIEIHPFSIMKYYTGVAELFDFVYATTYTGTPHFRQHVETFFDSYKDQKERFGRYLIAADIANPLWDSVYSSPEDLRRADPVSGSQLRLLEERVQRHLRGDDTVEQILLTLSGMSDVEYLKRISSEAGIGYSHWFTGSSIAASAAQLLSTAIEQKKLAELVEAVAIEEPAGGWR